MSSQEKIKIAIIGATSKFKGFGDNIGSSESFSKDLNDVKAINEIDKDFTSFYDSYPDLYNDKVQYFFFPKTIANKKCFLAIRAKKKFTAFPEQNRFYDRREYFYFDLTTDIDCINFASSLPEMIQYETKQLGQINTFEITKVNHQTDDRFTKGIVFSLLNESVLNIKINEQNHIEIQNKILGSLSILPDCCKQYLGFGFNIKGDSIFVKNNIHVLTTLDENGFEIDFSNPQKVHDDELNELNEALLNKRIDYDDTELVLLDVPLNRNALFVLLKYYKLHFQIDKYLHTSIPDSKKQNLFSESENYVETFLNNPFATDKYILKRIIHAYKFWQNNGLLKTDIFIWFWKKVNVAGIKHEKLYEDYDIRASVNEFIQIEYLTIKTFREIDSKYLPLSESPSFNIPNITLLDEIKVKYIKSSKKFDIKETKELEEYKQTIIKKANIDFQENLFNKVDFKSQASNISKSENFEILKDEIDKLNDTQIFALIKHIELTDLFNILQNRKDEKFLKNRNFYEPVLELLIKQGNLNDIIKWVAFFRENNSNVSFNTGEYLSKQVGKINVTSVFSLFDSICRSIVNNKSLFDKNNVSQFIQDIISKTNCQNRQFYSSAFDVANAFKFNIKVSAPLVKNENELMDFISMYNRNLNSISNNKIVGELTAEFFKSFLQHKKSIEEIFRFSNSNVSFVSANTNQFLEMIEELFSQASLHEKYSIILSLFRNIISEKKNLFLKSNSNLYNQITELEITDRNFVNEIYSINENIGKRNLEFTEVKSLINLLIDKYFKSKNPNAKFFTKMKNKISFINRDAKVALFFLLLFFIVATAGCFYLYLQNNFLSYRVNHQTIEIDSLKDNLQKLNDRINGTEKAINVNPVMDTTLLNPQPNNELNNNDVNVIKRQNLKGKPVSDIVTIIFLKNPTDIGSHYSGQKEAYVTDLIRRNPECFDKQNICVCDTLTHIPSYKNNQ